MCIVQIAFVTVVFLGLLPMLIKTISKRTRSFTLLIFAMVAVTGGSSALAHPPAISSFPPWSVATSRPIARELTFVSGKARLSGTLWLPDNDRANPVIVVYQGASDPLRTAPLYKHLIEMFPPIGIGVFVYDRRGTGSSSGPSADGSFELLADDGIAARRMLEKQPGVDPKRIGYWGLSQGGWLAALAAKRDPQCAFAIAISAPMVTADVQMRFAVANILRIRGYSQSVIDQAVNARRGVDDFMRGKISRAEAQRRLDAAATQPWFKLIYMGRTFHDPAKSGWAREMSNDPMSVIRTIKAPILVIYGAKDPWVPVKTSIERLATLLQDREHANLRLKVISNADHAMMTSASPLEQIDPKSFPSEAPDAPEYFAVMVQWLTSMGIGTTQRASGSR